MTYDEIVDEARARIRDAGRNLPNRLLLRQVGLRQANLFLLCATWNPEYYGVCVTASVTAAGLDLNGLAPPLNHAARIQRIEVDTTSGVAGAPAIGTRISIVPIDDPQSGLAPRMTLRDNALRPIGTDFAAITGIEIFYSRLPNPVTPLSGAVLSEMREPWEQLLVLDCALFIGQLLAAEGRDVMKGLLDMIAGEQNNMLAAFEAHVRGYVGDVADRFRRTGGVA